MGLGLGLKLLAPHTPRIACCSGSTRSSLTTSIRIATDGSAREKPAMNQTAGSTWWLRRWQNLALPRIGARRAAKRPRQEVNCVKGRNKRANCRRSELKFEVLCGSDRMKNREVL